MERTEHMQPPVSREMGRPERQTLQHRDASPLLSLGVLLSSIAVLCGVVMFTAYFENGQQGKAHTAVRSAPPIFIHH